MEQLFAEHDLRAAAEGGRPSDMCAGAGSSEAALGRHWHAISLWASLGRV